MPERPAQQVAQPSAPLPPAPGQKIVSSGPLGAAGVLERTYDEPQVTKHWRGPASSALTLVLVTRGGMLLEQRPIAGPWSAHTVHAGQLLLRPPERQEYEVHWRVTSAEPMETVHIYVQPDTVLRTAADFGGRQQREIIDRVGFWDHLLARLTFQLGAETLELTPADAVYGQAAVQLLLAHILRHHAVAPPDLVERPHHLTRRQVKEVTTFVRDHLHETLTLGQLAAYAGYSPYHFARLFKHATGASPHQFILQQRVDAAQRLLGETELSVQAIAAACGFASQSHLTHVFRRMLGTTPGAYRQARAT